VSDRVPPFDFSQLTREDLAARGGKVTTADFGKPSGGGSSFADWFDRLPRILAGQDLRELVEAIVAARGGQEMLRQLRTNAAKSPTREKPPAEPAALSSRDE